MLLNVVMGFILITTCLLVRVVAKRVTMKMMMI